MFLNIGAIGASMYARFTAFSSTPAANSQSSLWLFATAPIYMLCISLILALLVISRLNRRLRRQATTDPLTKIPNRRAFRDAFRRETAHSEAGDRPVSLCMIDIDHFKSINDEYGHDAGDLVLIEIARRISGHLHERQILARIGGEEFAILLPDVMTDDALTIAEQIRKK